jgi:hypothetical protein
MLLTVVDQKKNYKNVLERHFYLFLAVTSLIGALSPKTLKMALLFS